MTNKIVELCTVVKRTEVLQDILFFIEGYELYERCPHLKEIGDVELSIYGECWREN